MTTTLYNHAPLALAVIEIKHPQAELSRGELAGIKQQLHAVAPLQVMDQQAEFEIQMGPGGPQPGSTRTRVVPKYLARDRMTAISYGSDAITVETTNYRGWDQFRSVVEAALLIRQDVSPVDGFERVGLRYIDEIRLTEDPPANAWDEWVNQTLIAPGFSDFQMRQQQSAVQYDTGMLGHSLTLRYGAVNGPPAVSGGPNLVRPVVPAPGPYFLIDIDAAWTLPAGSSMPELDHALVLDIADKLHAPIKGLFESLITEKLRKEVFNHVDN